MPRGKDKKPRKSGSGGWNKGLTKETDVRVAKIAIKTSVGQKKRFEDPKEREKTGINTKEVLSRPDVKVKHKANIKEALACPDVKIRKSVSGIKRYEDPKEHEKSSLAQIKRYEDPKEHEKSSIAQIELWQNPEYRENQLKAIFKGLDLKPNKPEKILFKLLNKLFPKEWKYIGNGSLLIGYKNPDFVHISKKKIIELFGDYWHGEKRTGKTKEINEQKRINLFAKYGYQTLVIWEYELEDLDKLIVKILEFNKE